MPLSSATKSRISLWAYFITLAYLLNYIILRPLLLTSEITSTYYLDSMKHVSVITGFVMLILNILGLVTGLSIMRCDCTIKEK